MTNATWLEDILRDLAAIDQEGKLEQLATDFSLECRKRLLPTDSELRDVDADSTAKRIARFAAQMTGVSADECERLGRDIFRFHPRRDLLRELISFHLDRDQPTVSSENLAEEKPTKPARRLR